MLKRKKLLLTLLVCAAMTVLAAPLVVSIVNNEAPVLPDETTASTSSVTDYQNSSITEVVSTESTGNSYMPSLIVDSNGNIHVTWHDNTDYAGAGTDYDIFYKRYEVGVGWTVTEVVSTNSTDVSAYPSLAVDSEGNIHVTWNDFTDYVGSGIDSDIFYKCYEASTGNWTTAEVVSTESTDGSYFASIAVDSDGNIHIAWHDYTDYAEAGRDRDIFYKRSDPDKYWWLAKIMSTVEGLPEMKNLLENHGFIFDVSMSNVSIVEGGLYRKAFNGMVLSWWSSNMDTIGRMAFIAAAMMDDGNSMVLGAVTNLIPTEVLPAAGKYIIVNAMPYMTVKMFYYDTLNDRIVAWSYWWYNSHSHSNWFWNLYWKWRNYINEYYGWHAYLPWWWLWHYIYDKHWHNWSAEFPY